MDENSCYSVLFHLILYMFFSGEKGLEEDGFAWSEVIIHCK